MLSVLLGILGLVLKSIVPLWIIGYGDEKKIDKVVQSLQVWHGELTSSRQDVTRGLVKLDEHPMVG